MAEKELGPPTAPSPPPPDPQLSAEDKLELRQLRDYFLRLLFAYTAASFAGFVPLLQFALSASAQHRLPFPWVLSSIFVGGASSITLVFLGWSLNSFQAYMAAEGRLHPGIGPYPRTGPGASVLFQVYARSLDWFQTSTGSRALALLVDLFYVATVVMVLWIDLSLPW